MPTWETKETGEGENITPVRYVPGEMHPERYIYALKETDITMTGNAIP